MARQVGSWRQTEVPFFLLYPIPPLNSALEKPTVGLKAPCPDGGSTPDGGPGLREESRLLEVSQGQIRAFRSWDQSLAHRHLWKLRLRSEEVPGL